MNNKYFSDIYDDFFRVEKKEIEVKEDSIKEEVNLLEDINNLYLDNESKNLLKQIIEYMDKYSKKEESNYINFNILINGNNNETVNGVCRKRYKNKHHKYCPDKWHIPYKQTVKRC